MYIRSRLVK
jgi:alpha-tubulin suppressor-like RCC1 family protein